MARGKKSSTLGRNEFISSGRKFQVPIPVANLDNLKSHRAGESVFKIQACWSSFRIFYSYNAIVDPSIDCLALVKKSIAAKAAKYQVADIIPLRGWKDGVVVFDGLKAEENEQDDIPMLIADLQWDMVLGRKWLEKSRARLKDGSLLWLDDGNDKIRQEGLMANDLIRQPRELDEDHVQKDIVATTSSSPEIEKDISAYQEGMDHLVDELNEDVCQSRISITGDRCPQPLVRLPRRDVVQLYRPDDFVARIPEAPVVTSRENEIVTDEDLRPLVRLLDHRRHDEREDCFNGNTLLFDIEVCHHQCHGSHEGDRKEVSLSLSTPLSPAPDIEEIGAEWSHSCLLAADPVLEALLVEAAWNREDNVVSVYSKENEPNDVIRQVTPQTMDGYPDQDFDSDSNGVISPTSDV